jgi:hypothetical protein
VGCGRGCGHRKAEAEGLDEAGHGTGRAHDAAGSNGWAEVAADKLGFGCVDVAGAVLRPEAAAIGAGARRVRLCSGRRGMGPVQERVLAKFAGSLQSIWRFDIRGRQTLVVS